MSTNTNYGWTNTVMSQSSNPVSQMEIYYAARQMQAQVVREIAVKVGQAIAKVLRPVFSAVREGHARRQIFWELSSLDDRTLSDIGITRSDIPRVAAGLWTPERHAASVTAVTTAPSATNTNRPQKAA